MKTLTLLFFSITVCMAQISPGPGPAPQAKQTYIERIDLINGEVTHFRYGSRRLVKGRFVTTYTDTIVYGTKEWNVKIAGNNSIPKYKFNKKLAIQHTYKKFEGRKIESTSALGSTTKHNLKSMSNANAKALLWDHIVIQGRTIKKDKKR